MYRPGMEARVGTASTAKSRQEERSISITSICWSAWKEVLQRRWASRCYLWRARCSWGTATSQRSAELTELTICCLKVTSTTEKEEKKMVVTQQIASPLFSRSCQEPLEFSRAHNIASIESAGCSGFCQNGDIYKSVSLYKSINLRRYLLMYTWCAPSLVDLVLYSSECHVFQIVLWRVWELLKHALP